MEKLIRIFVLACVMFFGFVVVPMSVEALTIGMDGQPLVGDAYHHGGQLLAFDNLRAESKAQEWMDQNAKTPKPYLSNHERETGWHCPSFDNGLPRRSEWKEEMMGQFFAGNEGCFFTRVLAQGWFDFGYVNAPKTGDSVSWCEVDYVLVVTRNGTVTFILEDQHVFGWEKLEENVRAADWPFLQSSNFYSFDTDINYLSLLAVSKYSTFTEVTDWVVERILERLPVVKSIKVAEYFVLPLRLVPNFYLDAVDSTQGNVCAEGVNTSNVAPGYNCYQYGGR